MVALVLPHPAVERMALRRRLAEAVEQLLDTVDVLLRELAKDEPDADSEPSLGAPEHPAHLSRNGGWRIPHGVFDWSRGANDDREADGDHHTVVDADLEPSLGALPAMDQRRWSVGSHEDFEREHDGREPSLGSVAAERWADQRGWAAGGDQGEREEACDGEGEDRDECCLNLQLHDQRKLGTYAGEAIDLDDEPGEFVARCEVGLF